MFKGFAGLSGLVFGFLLAASAHGRIIAPTTLEVLSPATGAAFPEYSSAVLKVRVSNCDGTLRWFAATTMVEQDQLAYVNIPASAVVEVPLTNLASGNYEITVQTRRPSTYEPVTATINFSVTNRVRTMPKYALFKLPGSTNTTPAKLDNRGHVIGVSGGKAFLFDGTLRLLGTLGGPTSEAIAINDHGQIVGMADDAHGVRQPFIWEEGKGMQPLAVNGAPADINNRGEIIVNGPQGSFLYRNGTESPIPGPAIDLNEIGWVAGPVWSAYNTAGGTWNEFLRLHRPVFGEDRGRIEPIAINDANELTGADYSVVGGGRYAAVHAFSYRAFKRHRVTPAGMKSWAQAINRIGDITGWSSKMTYDQRGDVDFEGPPHAFLATRDGFALINDLLRDRGDADVTRTSHVNDRREIVGVATIGGEDHGVILRPLPEFQSVAIDANSGKIRARMDGFIGTRIRVETSADLKTWAHQNTYDLTDAISEIETMAPTDTVFVRAVVE